MRWGVLLLAGCQVACGGGQPASSGSSGPAPAGPARLELCVACHGRDGRAVLPGYPHLDGQDAAYLLAQLRAYRGGERRHAAMQSVAGLLDEAEMAALARYYADQAPCGTGS